jgi:ubiquitin-protein ligase
MKYHSPRELRLEEDYRNMQELVKKSKFISFEAFGSPPDRYIVTYTCKGIKLDEVTKEVVPANFHQVEIYLPTGYPRVKPNLEWLTPIYHPNIGSNGQVCLGGWAPAETLDRLCVRLGEIIQYKNYDEYDPLNASAASWALQNKHKLPVDTRPLEEVEKNEGNPYEIKLS